MKLLIGLLNLYDKVDTGLSLRDSFFSHCEDCFQNY